MFTLKNFGHNQINRLATIAAMLLIIISLFFVYQARASALNTATSATSSTTLSIYTESMTSGEVGKGWQVPSCAGTFDTAKYYTVPGLKKTFTTDSSSVLEINFSGLGRNSKNYGGIYSAIFVDGQKLTNTFGHEQLGGCRNDGSSSRDWTWCNVANIGAKSVDASSHTVEVKVKCDLNAEGRVWNGWLTIKAHGQ